MTSQSTRDTIKHILNTARRLLAERTENGRFTMDELAAEAGLSRATIYRHVGGRATLLQQLARSDGLKIDELQRPDMPTRILEATATVISQVGSFNITLDQVAEAAGIGVATIYRHFGDKETLLQAFSEKYTPRRAAQELVLRASAPLEENLTRFATDTLHFMANNYGVVRLLFSGDEMTRRLLSTLRNRQGRTMDSLTRYFQTQIDQGRLFEQDAADLATAFVGLLFGFALVRPAYPRRLDSEESLVISPVVNSENLDQTAAFVVRLFLEGAQITPEPV